MSKDELLALARKMAATTGLQAELVCAVCEQESGWDPWAMRYEAAFMAKYVAPLFTNNRVNATEAYARAMSWGLMQVMGEVARETGFEGKSLSELCDPTVGLSIGCVVLKHKLLAAKGNVTDALLLWNGGANPNYAAEVLARTEKYRT